MDMPSATERQSLFEACWFNAPGGMIAFHSGTGELIEVNPAAERLSGYSRSELIGSHFAMLHPESERTQVASEFLKLGKDASNHSGFHVQRKEGQRLPVMIRLWRSLVVGGRPVAVCVYHDITDQVEQEHLQAAQTWALSAYAEAALALGRARFADGLLQPICEAITKESAYALAWIGIADDDPEREIRIVAAAGSDMEYIDGLRVNWSENDPAGKGPTGTCIRTNSVQIMRDSEEEDAFAPWRERARQVGIRSNVAIPFSIDETRRGVLMVYSAHPSAFEPAAIEVFCHLAGQIGHGIHAIEQDQLLREEQIRLEKTQRRLSDALSAMVLPIVTAMEMRDPYTSGHQSRVAEIAVAIGKEMGWPEERLQGLRIAALVHDIGKISTPAEILNKPGKLSSSERLQINEHPETGHTILQGIPFEWPIAEMVRQHHEKLDGSGYPFGLKGDQILPEARVLAVADIVEAMASDRPYRKAIPLDRVLEEIESQSGALLDEHVVRVCASLIRERSILLAGQQD